MIASRPFGTSLHLSVSRLVNSLGLNLNSSPALIPLWYLRSLFFFVLLSPLFKIAVSKLKLCWLVMAYIIACLFTVLHLSGFFEYSISLSGVFYFSLGIYLNRQNIDFRSTPLAIGCASYGIIGLFARIYLHTLGVNLPIIIDSLILPTLLYSLWHFMPSRQFPVYLTSCSFSLFIMHYPILYFLNDTASANKIMNLDDQTYSIITCLFAIAASIITTHLIRKISPRTANFLFAGRS